MNGQIVYRSNPHMHLFEAALAWMAVDRDPEWRSLADELCVLATTKFIDEETYMSCLPALERLAKANNSTISETLREGEAA